VNEQPTTNRIQGYFGRPRVLLPVIHLPHGISGAIANVKIAMDAGADGVFLINQGMEIEEFPELIDRIRSQSGTYGVGDRERACEFLWIGINALGMDPSAVVRKFGNDVDGIWSDDARVDAYGLDAIHEPLARSAAELMEQAINDTMWDGIYFGGTAFKSQPEIPASHLGYLARIAMQCMDVITTSGRGTGMAADPEKLHAMHRVIGDHALALASGVTPENARRYLPYVDAFLVASGIEKSFGELDPARTKALAEIIHAPVA